MKLASNLIVKNKT